MIELFAFALGAAFFAALADPGLWWTVPAVGAAAVVVEFMGGFE